METEYTCFDVITLQRIKTFSTHSVDIILLVDLCIFLKYSRIMNQHSSDFSHFPDSKTLYFLALAKKYDPGSDFVSEGIVCCWVHGQHISNTNHLLISMIDIFVIFPYDTPPQMLYVIFAVPLESIINCGLKSEHSI